MLSAHSSTGRPSLRNHSGNVRRGSVSRVGLGAGAFAALPLLSDRGWIEPYSGLWAKNHFAQVVQLFALTDEQIKQLLWLGGIAGSLIGGAFTLFASWHFAEINLSQRLEDLRRANARDFISLQPRYLALARRGLGSIPADIETSRLTLLRSWASSLSWWGDKERARILAASAKQIGRDASALMAATREAQQRQITGHLHPRLPVRDR